ncbi:MAG: hypothetical protein ACLFXM_04415 [Acidimicrobiia bacterium]
MTRVREWLGRFWRRFIVDQDRSVGRGVDETDADQEARVRQVRQSVNRRGPFHGSF